MIARRQFLSMAGSGALVSLSPLVPNFLRFAAASQPEAAPGDRILVIVELTGGNDGLNTIVPYADDAYRAARKTLAIGRDKVLKINDTVGFAPALRGFAELFEAGRLAVLQGIGYPNPDRSHFTSMDIWQTGRRNLADKGIGWLGRYLDGAMKQSGGDAPALHLGGKKQPLALAARDVHALSAQSLASFRLEVAADDPLAQEIDAALAAKRPENDLLSFVQTSATSALAASHRMRETQANYATPVTYPQHALGEQLRWVAQLIDSGFKTRIYYVALDGFDTHSQQANVHARLLEQLSGAVTAFVNDLAHHGHLDRTAVMMFSEFGRRVTENASGGTDHGAAAPMFLAGGRIEPGVIGAHPSLADLDDGDLKHHTDFRQVYAALLDQWIQWPSEQILGERFEPVRVFRA